MHQELQRIARRCLRGERPGHSLQATVLVNEAYLRLVDVAQVKWQDRTHFLAMAARVMRRVLVDLARVRGSQKRGRAPLKVSLAEGMLTSEKAPDLVALDEALEALAKIDSRKSQVVELRFFGGLSLEETAEALAVSSKTVTRDFNLAKVWLLRELDRRTSQVPR